MTLLRYSAPATVWEESLPIGNGRLGAMIKGCTTTEIIHMNEDSVCYGGPQARHNPNARTALPEIRRLIAKGKIPEAEELARSSLTGMPRSMRHYEALGDLVFEFGHGSDPKPGGVEYTSSASEVPVTDSSTTVMEYTRELDLCEGVQRVSYTCGGVKYHRESFASVSAQVMVFHLRAINGVLNFNWYLDRRSHIDINKGQNRFMDSLTGIHNGLKFTATLGGPGAVQLCCVAKTDVQDGEVVCLGDTVFIRGATEARVVVAAETTFRHKDPSAKCLSLVEDAMSKTYSQLQQAHITEHKALFGRMTLSLGSKGTVQAFTNQRLHEFQTGKIEDLDLISLYFQYGRYLLLSSSRPGTLPANLQGIWNNDLDPIWLCQYTINLNIEMNYWPSESCNLAECHTALFDHLSRIRRSGQVTAEKMYGCRGFVAHHNTDIWADTVPQDRVTAASYWPLGGAWLCLHIWEHYRFTGDTEFLRANYPIMLDAATFFVDFMVKKDEKFVVCPSISPENRFILPSGEVASLCAGAACDSQILVELFGACIKGGEILEIDKTTISTLETTLDRIPRPEIGKSGRVKEWLEDYEEYEPGHRHFSHLFFLYPGTAPVSPELEAAAMATIEWRLSHGGGHTGWSRAWLTALYARLHDGEAAYKHLCELLRHSTYISLLDSHPPFQIDGNLGATAAIGEMLLQSHAGRLEVLPAIPKAWKDGRVSGLCARGGFELDIEWKDGDVTRLSILSKIGNDCVLSRRRLDSLTLGRLQAEVSETEITFRTQPGMTNVLTV